MTPQELAYYQQQQQEQEGGLLDFLGKAALAAGAVVGGIAGARYLRGRAPQQPQRRAPAQNYEAVRRVAATQMPENPAVTRSQAPPPPTVTQSRAPLSTGTTSDRIRRMDQLTREARAERPQGVIQADLSELQATRRAPLEEDPELISLVREQQVEDALEEQRFIDQENRRQTRVVQGVESKEKAQAKNILSSMRAENQIIEQTPKDPTVFLKTTLENSGYIPAETEAQQATVSAVSVQNNAAINAAEDQETGRVRAALQRNEDVPLNLVDELEEYSGTRAAMRNPDDAINTVARSLPDGLPVDQAEEFGKSSAQRFLQRERDEIASELGEQGLLPTSSRIETELSNRLGKSAYEYGPKYSARKQALELYAQTGDVKLLNRLQRFGLSPASFETFETMPAEKRIGFENAPPLSTSYYPSEELSAQGLSSNININLPTRGQTNLAEFRKPVVTETTAQAAEDYYQTKKGQALDWLGDLRVQLEPKRNQILKERRTLAEQAAQEILPQLQNAREANNQGRIAELEQNLNVLRTIWKNPRLGSHRQDELNLLDAQVLGAQNKIAESISGIQKKYPTTIADWSGESARIFGELNTETGELIPETIEIRGERPAKDIKAKGGGGRNVAEFTAGERLDEEIRKIQGGGRIRDYDPETGAAASQYADDRTQTGRELDIYGVRFSSQPKDDPELKPTDVQIPIAGLANPYARLDEETLNQMTLMGSPADQYNAAKELSRRKVAGEEVSLGGIQSTREPLTQLPTETARRSVLMSEAVFRAARQQASRNPRGGVLPDEITQLRRQMAQLEPPAEPVFTRRPPGPRPGAVPPQQLTLKGASGFKARQTKSPADVAAEQLENYMSKLQRGRSTPLTSEVVIQPRLF